MNELKIESGKKFDSEKLRLDLLSLQAMFQSLLCWIIY